MPLYVFSCSTSFNRYLSGMPDIEIVFFKEFHEDLVRTDSCLVHLPSMQQGLESWLKRAQVKTSRIAVCADMPDILQMLSLVRMGVQGYCNSYMRTQHYQQMIRLLADGYSWFPPEMLTKTFDLAHQALHGKDITDLLQPLTRRERQVAQAVLESQSNREIAERFAISEPTVKTHLTNIFKKLNVKDRVDLVLYLKQA